MMPKSTLRTLDLSVNPLSGAGDTLGELLDGPLMDEIMFKGCALTPEDIGAIAEQLPFTGIKSLQLAGNHFGREGLEALCEHLADSQIEELGILGEAWAKRPFPRVKLAGNRIPVEEIKK